MLIFKCGTSYQTIPHDYDPHFRTFHFPIKHHYQFIVSRAFTLTLHYFLNFIVSSRRNKHVLVSENIKTLINKMELELEASPRAEDVNLDMKLTIRISKHYNSWDVSLCPETSIPYKLAPMSFKMTIELICSIYNLQ